VSEPRPLAAASQRLRARPGRPRRAARAASPLAGQASAPLGAPLGTRGNARAVAVVWLKQGGEWTPAQARLLDLASAAAYLGVSGWTIRDYVAAGILARVKLPAAHGAALKRLLFDVGDLDRLIEASRD